MEGKMKSIVTGGTGGIGYELVLQLQEKGWEVVTCGRNAGALETLNGFASVRALPCDMSDPRQVLEFCDRLVDEGPFDLVINNAGIMVDELFDATTPEQIEREVAVNLTAPMILTRAILPLLAPGAKLVNVGSVLGRYPKRGTAVYSATKAGLEMFSEALRVQAGDRFSVHHVYPPQVATGLSPRSAGADTSAGEAASAILRDLEKGERDVWVGKARMARVLGMLAPWAMRRIMAGH
jgi:uncharacterized oxidoreductase